MAPLVLVPSLDLEPSTDAIGSFDALDLPAPPRPAPQWVRWVLQAAVVGTLVGLWWRLLDGGFHGGVAWLEAIPGLGPIAFWVQLAGMGFLALTTLRSLLWLLYRPTAVGDFFPTISALVPAYNEGAMVRNALLSLARADYPAGRLQVIGIDDGSRDDTWTHMQAAAQLHPDRIRLIRMPRNGGKRAALHAGFQAAEGDIIVTADSDCIVARDALRHLVAPLANPTVGAVAGKVVVHNRRGSILARLLAPQFLVTFDFLRASQSVVGTVLCCPGALAAYRFSALRPLLSEWLTQSFWGTRVGPGEDRFLTTLLMRAGYEARYQSSALVHTLVPLSYQGVCRMLLRWDRSDVRESLAALVRWPRRQGWSRLAIVVFQAQIVGTLLGVPLSFISVYAVLAVLFTHPLIGLLAVGTLGLPSAMGIAQALCADFSVQSLWLIGYAYFAPALIWIQPFAALTLRDQAWMSRRVPPSRVEVTAVAA